MPYYENRRCQLCNTEYLANRYRHGKYCSDACRQAAYRVRKAEIDRVRNRRNVKLKDPFKGYT